MKQPNREVISTLLDKHMQVNRSISLLHDEGIHIEVLEQLDLFNIVLDMIGFPEDTEWRVFGGRPSPEETFSREAWEHLAAQLKPEGVDAFIDELYADCEELKITHPQFFTQSDHLQ